jgi:hypothetical protein
MAIEKDLRFQEIQEKIQHLQQEQTALDQKMIHDLFFFLKSHQAFSYPFDALLGGFIEVLETLSLDTDKTENWRQKGEHLRSKKKPRNINPDF